jgi:hypothetical protein
METINDLIINEFERNGYELCDDQQLAQNQYLFKHKTYADYWLITHGLKSFENQKNQFDTIRNFDCIDKNVSMLIVDRKGEEEMVKVDYVRIENDPFFFKKYILTYTDASVSQLVDIMKNCQAESVGSLVMKPEAFDKFYEEQGDGPYTLLYMIVHKLPFIPLEIHSRDINLDAFNRLEEDEVLRWVVQQPIDDEETLTEAIKSYLNLTDYE